MCKDLKDELLKGEVAAVACAEHLQRMNAGNVTMLVSLQDGSKYKVVVTLVST